MRSLLRRELIRRAGLGWLRARDLRATGNPLADDFDLLLGKFLLRLGHFAIADQREERTLFRLARDDGCAVLAALREQVAEARVEAALELLSFAVAGEAIGFEDGSDVFLEGQRGRRGGLGGGGEGSGGQQGPGNEGDRQTQGQSGDEHG